MKKILVLSDSHSEFDVIYNITLREKPNYVFFTGDYVRDGLELSYVFKDIPFYIVKGNCDFNDYITPEEIIVDLEGFSFFILHGHRYGVKMGIKKLEKEAKKKEVDIVVFGHTHRQFFDKKDGIVYINPGAALNKKYGVIKIENNNKVEVKLSKIDV